MKRIHMRRKTRRRLTLAAVVAVVGGLAAVGLFGVRKWQINARRDAERTLGLSSFESGSRMDALNHLGAYIKAKGRASDPEALRAYGLTRAKVSEPDGRHLREAVDILGRYLTLRPDDRATRLEMMKLANRAGMPVDARDSARQLRPEKVASATAADIPVLKEEMRAHLGLKIPQRADAEALITRMLELAPTDAEVLGQYLSMLQLTSRESECRVWAEGQLAKDPTNPNLKLIAALARLVIARDANDLPGARTALLHAAGMREDSPERSEPITNGDYAAMLVLAFDDLKMHQHSLATLRAAKAIPNRPDLQAALARRLWTESLDEELVKATDAINIADPEVDTDTIAFRAMALKRLEREGESRPLIAALKEREWDFKGRGWFPAMNAMDASKSANPGELVKSLRLVVNDKMPEEPVIHAWLGDALAANSQMEEARAMWRKAAASPLSPNWAAPLVRITESLISDNRTEEAAKVATEALQASPNRLLVNAVWLEAHAARLSSGSSAPPTATELLPRLEELWKILKDQQGQAAEDLARRLVPIRVVLLNRAGRTPEATAAMRASLATTPPPSPDFLRRAAAINLSERLGLESLILDLIAKADANSAQSIYARAATAAIAGRPQVGLQLFKDMIPDPAKAPSDLRTAYARYLDFINDPGAAQALIDLGRAYPEVLDIQNVCLESNAAASDRAFIAETITRYRQLTRLEEPASDARINTARARALLSGTPSDKDRDEAIAVLTALVKEQPDTPGTRVLLANAMLSGPKPDTARAIPHLEVARRLKPGDASVALRLARLYEGNDRDKARSVLSDFIRVAPDNAGAVMEAASILAEIGQPAQAMTTMRELIDRLGAAAGPEAFLRLAELQAAASDGPGVRATIDRLMKAPTLDASSALVGAGMLRVLGDRDAADAAMKKAEALENLPVRRLLMRARYVMAGTSDPVESERLLREAVALEPSLEEAWLQLASLLMGTQNLEKAEQAARAGLKEIPESAKLGILLAQAERARTGGENASLAPLIAQLGRDPSSAKSVPMLEEVEKLRASNRLSDPTALEPLAAKYPGHAALQIFVIEKLLAATPPALSLASDLATKAMARFPDSPDAARLASGCMAQQQRWNEALSAGRAWAQRDPSRPIGADVVIAESQTRLGQAAQALQTLAPRLQPALKEPEVPLNISVIHTYGRALIVSGKENEARALWRPRLAGSSVYRVRVWLDAAARDVANADNARTWISEVLPMLAADSTEEQLAYAGALSTVAVRSTSQHRASMLAEAETVLTTLAGAAPSPGVLDALAATRQAAGNAEGAKEAFLKSLEIGGDRPLPLASLAQAELAAGRLEAAQGFAQRAAKVDPTNRFAAESLFACQRTTGERALAKGDRAGAKAAFSSARAALAPIKDRFPGELPVLGQWAQACQLAGDYAGAASAYQSMLSLQIPDSMKALIRNNRAYVLLRDPDATVEEIREARTLAEAAAKVSDTPDVKDTLGWALIRDGQRSLAVEQFRSVLAAAPDNPSAMLGLAESLSGVGLGADQRREASDLLARFDAAAKAGKVTTLDLFEIADKLREKLR